MIMIITTTTAKNQLYNIKKNISWKRLIITIRCRTRDRWIIWCRRFRNVWGFEEKDARSKLNHLKYIHG